MARDLVADIQADINDLKQGLDRATGEVRKFRKSAVKESQVLGSVFKGVFAADAVQNFARIGIRAISDFTKKSIELAESAQGVVPAFERLNRPGLLGNLRAATGGAVTDLKLMEQAVRAENFQIPLEQMAKLFEFATIRARETGDSVDHLVRSIISGIGRKSPLILDNLGISAVRLRKELRGVGVEMANVEDIADAIGKIVDQEMTEMNRSVEEVVTSTELLNTAMDNLALTIGDGLKPATDELKTSLASAAEGLDATLKSSLNFFQKVGAAGAAFREGLNIEFTDIFGVDERLLQRARDEMEALAQGAKNATQDVGALLEELGLAPEKTIKVIELTAKELKKLNDEAFRAFKERTKQIERNLAYADSLEQIRLEAAKLSEADLAKDLSNLAQSFEFKPETPAIGAFDIPDEIAEVIPKELETEIRERLSDANTAASEGTRLLQETLAGGLGSIGQSIGNSIAGLSQGLNGIIFVLLDFAKQFGKLLISIGVAKVALEKIGISGVGAIVAGTALVALSTAIKGLLSKGPAIPSLAIGTDTVRSGGLAQLHKGETIVPAQVAAGGFSGGPQTIIVEGVLKSGDIYIANKEGERKMNLTN